MQIGFVSDAHGNSSGLSLCLKFLSEHSVDKIYFLGDAVGYMPDWAGVFALLDEYKVECLQGNHDRMAYSGVVESQRNLTYRLTPELIEANALNLSRAASWPSSIDINVGNKKLLLVHGSPWQPLDGYVYPDSSVVRFESVEADAVFMGHTHRPFIKLAYEKCLVNVGSCGLPRDVGNLASCGIYDAAKDECVVYRIPFDVEKIISSYRDDLHESVIDCLRRRADNYFGILID
jgi:putative phosphoesterase